MLIVPGAAWRLMGADMYTGMSALEEASPVVARGVALHKLLRALTMVTMLEPCTIAVPLLIRTLAVCCVLQHYRQMHTHTRSVQRPQYPASGCRLF